jgi:hypothetical protein
MDSRRLLRNGGVQEQVTAMRTREWLTLPLIAGFLAFGAPALAGQDATCQGKAATVVGTAGSDSETGTPRADVAAMRAVGTISAAFGETI